MRRFVLVLAALAVLPAAAQQGPGASGDVGFFRPQPNDDVSLTHTLPPEAYQSIPSPTAPAAPAAPAPAPAPAVPQAPATPTAAPLVVVVPDVTRRTEDEMDRSRDEAAIANAAAAGRPHINGAFTGLTDERDR